MRDRPWQFMVALETPELMAGEYLSGRTPTSAGLEFDALLLRRAGVEDWQVRSECALFAISRGFSVAGETQWVDYVGRDDTVEGGVVVTALLDWALAITSKHRYICITNKCIAGAFWISRAPHHCSARALRLAC